jgi:uncharacterized protein
VEKNKLNMLTYTTLLEVIEHQSTQVKLRNAGVNRVQLNQIELHQNFAIIITGIRRCGKSTLMCQLLKNDTEEVLFLNFEDPRLASFEVSDFQRLYQAIEIKGVKTVFFDEIQVFDSWELFIRQLLDNDFRVVITGSNASLLSRELGTKLTGRHLSYELFPFNFQEFLSLMELPKNDESVALFFKTH